MDARLANPTKLWRPFPELKNAEIVQVLEELRIPLTENDIMKPNPQTIQRVYELFLELFVGIQPSSAKAQPNFEIVDLLENPEIHLDAISLMTFYKNISKLMDSVGIVDFSLKDVIKPETPRIRMILSGVINFAKFREEQLIFFEQFSNQTEELARRKQTSDLKLKDTQKKLQILQKQRQDEQPQADLIKEKIAALGLNLKDLKKEQISVGQQLDVLKTKKDEQSDTISAQQYSLVTIKQDIARLQSRVVSNPDQLINSIKEMSAELSSLKEATVSLESNAKALTLRSTLYGNASSELSKILVKMQEVHDLLTKRNTLETHYTAEKENLSRKEQYAEEISQKEVQMRRQLSSQQEKIDKLNLQQRQRRKDIEESLKSLEDEYEKVTKERKSVEEKILANERVIKEIENNITDAKRHHEAQVNQLLTAVSSLKTQISTYNQDLKMHLQ